MRWLAVRGLAYRVRAALLLLAFTLGSIVARDAALLQRLQADAPVLMELVVESRATLVDNYRRAKLKVRPSGMSKRTALSPTDPPDDDDELDDDSDSFAASSRRALAVAAASPLVVATEEGARLLLARAASSDPTAPSHRLRRQRGPPR